MWNKLLDDKELFESKHRFCALGLKLSSSDVPSNVCTKILSTRLLLSHKCTCGISFKEHKNDWKPKLCEPDRVTHRDALMRFYKFIVNQGMLKFDTYSCATKEICATPGTPRVPAVNLSFPTNELVEQKTKRRKNKVAEPEVEIRTKVAKEDIDDCGTDISGLGCNENVFVADHSLDDEEPLVLGMNTGWLKGSSWQCI